jgi:hypothetical protein
MKIKTFNTLYFTINIDIRLFVVEKETINNQELILLTSNI